MSNIANYQVIEQVSESGSSKIFHAIKDSDSMLRVLRDSTNMALKGHIVTIGVKPNFPSTGYGYIQYENKESVEKCTL